MRLIDKLLSLRRFLAAPLLRPIEFQDWLSTPEGTIYLPEIQKFSQEFEALLNSIKVVTEQLDTAKQQEEKIGHENKTDQKDQNDKSDQQSNLIQPMSLKEQWSEAIVGMVFNKKTQERKYGLLQEDSNSVNCILLSYPAIKDFLKKNIDRLKPAGESWLIYWVSHEMKDTLTEINKSEMAELTVQQLEKNSGRSSKQVQQQLSLEPQQNEEKKAASNQDKLSDSQPATVTQTDNKVAALTKKSSQKSGKSEISRPAIYLPVILSLAKTLAHFLTDIEHRILVEKLTKFAYQCDSFIGTPRLKYLIVLYEGMFSYIASLPSDHSYRSFIPKICATIENGFPIKSQFFTDKPEFDVFCSGNSYETKVENYFAQFNYWESIHRLLNKYRSLSHSSLATQDERVNQMREYTRLMDRVKTYLEALKEYKIELDKTAPPPPETTQSLPDDLTPLTQSSNPESVAEETPNDAELSETTLQGNSLSSAKSKPDTQNPFAEAIRQKLNNPSAPQINESKLTARAKRRTTSDAQLELEHHQKRARTTDAQAAQTIGLFAVPAIPFRRTHSDFPNNTLSPLTVEALQAEMGKFLNSRKRRGGPSASTEPSAITDELRPSAAKCQA